MPVVAVWTRRVGRNPEGRLRRQAVTHQRLPAARARRRVLRRRHAQLGLLVGVEARRAELVGDLDVADDRRLVASVVSLGLEADQVGRGMRDALAALVHRIAEARHTLEIGTDSYG